MFSKCFLNYFLFSIFSNNRFSSIGFDERHEPINGLQITIIDSMQSMPLCIN